jgi:bifunctional enzyme CysN/CysC
MMTCVATDTSAPPSLLSRAQMNIVIAGHVDHGKSTIIGRLLADTDSLPQGKLEQIRQKCRRNSKPFEYAFLLDALKDEQAQGITIDSARVFFKTPRRNYIIIDAPGHIEFLKNMVTGASRAEAALLVIDAEEGVRENSRRHGYMLSLLGIHQIAVLVNKMDLVGYRQEVYEAVCREYGEFLQDVQRTAAFVPVSGLGGDNIATPSSHMPWYQGMTVLGVLDGFVKEMRPVDKPFRMPVQDVYKFTEQGDKRRIVVGTIETGRLRAGDEVVFYPSGKTARVQSLEAYHRPPQEQAEAGQAAAFTLEKQIYVARGEIAALAGQVMPRTSTRLRVNLFWMGHRPMVKGKEYLIKVGTVKEKAFLEDVLSVMDASDLHATRKKDRVEHHDVAECVIVTRRAIAFDLAQEIAGTGRFVIVDNYEICGGGIIRAALADEQLWMREKVIQRNAHWVTSTIAREERAQRYSQKPALVLLTGRRHVGKKPLAEALEMQLFGEGRFVYFLGIGNVLYGVDADIKEPGQDQHRSEHLRRLAEVANLLLGAGLILIVTATDLTHQELEWMRTAIDHYAIHVVWLGPESTDIPYDLRIPHVDGTAEAVVAVKGMLQNHGIIFKP